MHMEPEFSLSDVDLKAVEQLRVRQPPAACKIIVIDLIADDVACPARQVQGKAQKAAVPVALPRNIRIVGLRHLRYGGAAQRGLHVAAEDIHDRFVDGLGVRCVVCKLRDMVGIVPFLTVFIGERAFFADRFRDETVVVAFARRRRECILLAAGCQLRAEYKAKERAQRPEKAAVMLHVWYLLIDHW